MSKKIHKVGGRQSGLQKQSFPAPRKHGPLAIHTISRMFARERGGEREKEGGREVGRGRERMNENIFGFSEGI